MRATRRLCALSAVATGVATVVVLGAAPAQAAPGNDYEMPFPCGQAWTGTTRPTHSPSSRAVDWNRPDDVGDPVVASAPGTVSVATHSSSGYGNYVRVAHANGESTIYAHLQSLAVKVGQTVDQGAMLGAVGTSGNSTGPHLHFEERNSQGVMWPWFGGKSFVFGSYAHLRQLRGRAGGRQLHGGQGRRGGRLPPRGRVGVPDPAPRRARQGDQVRHLDRPAGAGGLGRRRPAQRGRADAGDADLPPASPRRGLTRRRVRPGHGRPGRGRLGRRRTQRRSGYGARTPASSGSGPRTAPSPRPTSGTQTTFR